MQDDIYAIELKGFSFSSRRITPARATSRRPASFPYAKERIIITICSHSKAYVYAALMLFRARGAALRSRPPPPHATSFSYQCRAGASQRDDFKSYKCGENVDGHFHRFRHQRAARRWQNAVMSSAPENIRLIVRSIDDADASFADMRRIDMGEAHGAISSMMMPQRAMLLFATDADGHMHVDGY